MADFDVAVVGLQTPAATGPLTTLRPAISVRNNGIHDALASGYLRIYSAGLLIFETEVYSATIAPGETGLAQAIDYWTPESIGTYTVSGYVSCPLDQVEPNNNLDPTTITITDEPAPPTPPVLPHAAQHEEGAADELSIDGLAGRTAEPQVPFAHASNHQDGGSDEMDVTDLPGLLAAEQTPLGHKATHQNGGADELQVAGLSGQLADPQPPIAHQTSHQHGESDELDVDGLPGLLADAQQALGHDAGIHITSAPVGVAPGWTASEGASENATKAEHVHPSPGAVSTLTAPIVINPTPEYIASINVAGEPVAAGTQIHLMASGLLDTATPPALLTFKVYAGALSFQFVVSPNPGLSAVAWRIEVDIVVTAIGPAQTRSCGHLHLCPGTAACDYYIAAPAGPLAAPATLWGITAEFTAPAAGDICTATMNEVRISKL